MRFFCPTKIQNTQAFKFSISIFIFFQTFAFFPHKVFSQILTGPIANPVETRTNATLSTQILTEQIEIIQSSESDYIEKPEENEENAAIINTQDENIDKSEIVAEQIQQFAPKESEEIKAVEEKIEIQPIGIDYPKNNALVKKYIEQYTSNYGKKWLVTVMQNGSPYRGYIKAKIAEYGIPECLEFLPIIESSFRIDAVSKSGAMGLWQFMKNSISPFGIRVNEWMDERCDPWLATDAALKKLKENYGVLNDWALALAAYNAGLGAITRASKNYNANYWTLAQKKKIKNETIQYVPKFIAIAHILTNAKAYGIELPEYESNAHQNFTVLQVNRNMDISMLSELAEIDVETMKFLNPALLYGVTPPGVNYGLRLPVESLESVQKIVQDEAIFLLKYHRYKIKSGDNLSTLARHYGVSVKMITDANPKIKPNSLQIGKTILIPAFKDVAPYAGKSKASGVKYSGSYTVKKGDNLWNISQRYGVQVEELAEENNIELNATLREGRVLKVPILKTE